MSFTTPDPTATTRSHVGSKLFFAASTPASSGSTEAGSTEDVTGIPADASRFSTRFPPTFTVFSSDNRNTRVPPSRIASRATVSTAPDPTFIRSNPASWIFPQAHFSE